MVQPRLPYGRSLNSRVAPATTWAASTSPCSASTAAFASSCEGVAHDDTPPGRGDLEVLDRPVPFENAGRSWASSRRWSSFTKTKTRPRQVSGSGGRNGTWRTTVASGEAYNVPITPSAFLKSSVCEPVRGVCHRQLKSQKMPSILSEGLRRRNIWTARRRAAVGSGASTEAHPCHGGAHVYHSPCCTTRSGGRKGDGPLDVSRSAVSTGRLRMT